MEREGKATQSRGHNDPPVATASDDGHLSAPQVTASESLEDVQPKLRREHMLIVEHTHHSNIHQRQVREHPTGLVRVRESEPFKPQGGL
jgi:hypothetical protein